jgi:HlyD family secretion protein
MKYDMINARTALLAGLALALIAGGCAKKESGALEASGIIETTDVTVSSRAVGNVMRMDVREGDRVRAGQVLLVVDDSDLQLQKKQLLAGVDVATYQYDLVRNGARGEDVAQADEAVRQAKLAMDNAADDERRYGEMLTVGSISKKDYLNVKTKADVAARQYDAARIAYEKLRNGSRREEVSTAGARREQASAQLAAIDKKIEDCTVTSPLDGVVTRKAVEMGEFVNMGSNLVTITKTDVVKLKIYVPEDQLGRVKLGQTAKLKIDTFKDKVYNGRVTYIAPTAEFTPKNVQTKDDRVKLVYEVQIEAPNTDGDLKAGITAEAVLEGGG